MKENYIQNYPLGDDPLLDDESSSNDDYTLYSSYSHRDITNQFLSGLSQYLSCIYSQLTEHEVSGDQDTELADNQNGEVDENQEVELAGEPVSTFDSIMSFFFI